MTTNKAHPRPRIESIHNPLARGEATLFMPGGLLVRWPDRTPFPEIGAEFDGKVVRVPLDVRAIVLTFLCDRCGVSRSAAATRLAANKHHKQRILHALFSRSYVEKLLAGAERLPEEALATMKDQAETVSVRKLLRAAAVFPSENSGFRRGKGTKA